VAGHLLGCLKIHFVESREFSRQLFHEALHNIDFSSLSSSESVPGDLPDYFYRLVHDYIINKFKDIAKAAKNSYYIYDFVV
jgi:hypothetical protein